MPQLKTSLPGLQQPISAPMLSLQNMQDFDVVMSNPDAAHGDLYFFDNAVRKPLPVSNDLLTLLLNKNKIPKLRATLPIPDGATGKGTVLALLDSGIAKHKALKNKVIASLNADGSDAVKSDQLGHGTHLAGIVVAQAIPGDIEMSGIAPDAQLISVRVTEDNYDYAPIWRITEGLATVLKLHKTLPAGQRPTAVLISFNATDNVSKPIGVAHHRLAQLIEECNASSIPVICSAGNSYVQHAERPGLAYPAYIPGVIAVAACENAPSPDKKNVLTKTTQRINPEKTHLSVCYTYARGAQTLSTGIASESAYSFLSGSSQAAAVVAATVLLLQSAYALKHNGAMPSVNEIKSSLPNTL